MDKKLFARLLESVKQADEIVRGERAPAREFGWMPHRYALSGPQRACLKHSSHA